MKQLPAAKDAYTREDMQMALNAITELQKLVMQLSEYTPQVDVTTGKNVKMTIDNLVAVPVEI